MRGHTVIRRYARALYEVCRDNAALEELARDRKVLSRLFSEAPEIRRFCLSPSDSPRKNRILMETAFLPYLSTYTVRTVEALFRNNRLEALPWLADALREEFDRAGGITEVVIEAAAEQDEQDRNLIAGQLAKRLGAGIRPVWRIRPELLGGLTFQWNNLFLDLSLRGRLNQLKGTLKRKTI
jgi:F-type H+-transporting ATPase subunit delta